VSCSPHESLSPNAFTVGYRFEEARQWAGKDCLDRDVSLRIVAPLQSAVPCSLALGFVDGCGGIGKPEISLGKGTLNSFYPICLIEILGHDRDGLTSTRIPHHMVAIQL